MLWVSCFDKCKSCHCDGLLANVFLSLSALTQNQSWIHPSCHYFAWIQRVPIQLLGPDTSVELVIAASSANASFVCVTFRLQTFPSTGRSILSQQRQRITHQVPKTLPICLPFQCHQCDHCLHSLSSILLYIFCFIIRFFFCYYNILQVTCFVILTLFRAICEQYELFLCTWLFTVWQVLFGSMNPSSEFS